MRITFAKYAFKDILEQLEYSGITDICITKEDNNLIIVVPETAIKQTMPYTSTSTDVIVSKSQHIDGKQTKEASRVVAIC